MSATATHQLCLKCGGQGHVAKPPWVPGDIEHWMATDTGSYSCRVCAGHGVIALAGSSVREEPRDE